MELKGKLKQVNEIVERGSFKSRKIWIVTEENPEYPQTIELEINQAKTELFAGVSIGAPVVCHINVRGREWTNAEGKVQVFNTLVCWKVVADGMATTAPATQAPPPARDAQPPIDDGKPLPF